MVQNCEGGTILKRFLFPILFFSLSFLADYLGTDGKQSVRELLNDVGKDWKKLIQSQDVDAIVNKYTEDCIYIHKKNGKTDIVVGRESELNLIFTLRASIWMHFVHRP